MPTSRCSNSITTQAPARSSAASGLIHPSINPKLQTQPSKSSPPSMPSSPAAALHHVKPMNNEWKPTNVQWADHCCPHANQAKPPCDGCAHPSQSVPPLHVAQGPLHNSRKEHWHPMVLPQSHKPSHASNSMTCPTKNGWMTDLAHRTCAGSKRKPRKTATTAPQPPATGSSLANSSSTAGSRHATHKDH